MSRWHREHPEYYEQYGEPPWTDLWDMRDKTLDRRPSVDLPEDLAPCRVCGEELTKNAKPCSRCERGMEHDRLERESNR